MTIECSKCGGNHMRSECSVGITEKAVNREQTFKMLEGRIDTMTALAIESLELVYAAGRNEGLEDAAIEMERIEMILSAAHIRRLKK